MAKMSIFLALFTVLIAIPMMHGLIDQSPEAVEKWFEELRYKEEKVTKFHFYLHDQSSGKNPTAFTVAQSNITFTTSPSFFGLTSIIDDALTVGPDPNSELIGRAQGLTGSASLSEISLVMNVNFVFTSGKYNGSTLSLQGSNPISHKYREMSIVGGSGAFRLARGIVTGKTFSINATSFDIIVDYHAVVIHY